MVSTFTVIYLFLTSSSVMFSSVFKTIFRLTERLPQFNKAVADTCTFKKEKLYGFEFSVLLSILLCLAVGFLIKAEISVLAFIATEKCTIMTM